MSEIKECTNNLIKAILGSEEYIRFEKIRKAVNEQPELKQQIDDFRLHVFQVQNSSEPLDMYEEQEKLCKNFEEFRKNPLVDQFLSAELRVCRIIQKITMDMAMSINLEIDDISGKVGF